MNNNNNNNELATEPVGKLLLKYSMPAIIGMTVNALYISINRLFIANIPDSALAISGIGVSVPVMTMLMAFSMLLAAGTATNMSLRLGEGKTEMAQRLVGNATSLSVIAGVALTLLYFIFGDFLLRLFGASTNSFAYAKKFMDMFSLGFAPWILSLTLTFTMRADGSPRRAGVIMIIGAVVNVVLDYLLIIKLEMGVAGAGLGVALTEFVTLALCLEYYLNGKSNLKFEYSFLKLDKKLVKMIVSIGMTPFVIQGAMSLSQITINNLLLKYGGDLAIGAMTTIMTILMLFFMPAIGITQGMQPIVGYNYGARHLARARRVFILAAIAGTALLTVGMVCTEVFSEQIVGLFNKDPELLRITIDGIRKNTFTIPLIAFSVTGSTYILSIGKARLAMLLSLLRQIVVLIPCLFILPLFLGLDGIWFSQPVGDIASVIVVALVIYYEFKSYKKMRRHI
ncbi:MATE family efflux transporter [Deferribacterales bacterium]|nr:MATE family efflux transporter [Deferribacterales bacterium]